MAPANSVSESDSAVPAVALLGESNEQEK